MAIVKSRSSKEKISLSAGSALTAVRVLDVILDINHPLAEVNGYYDVIGTIKYNNLSDPKPNSTYQLPSAKPLFYSFSQYPTVNEIVYILAGPRNNFNKIGAIKEYYLPPLNIHGSPNHNA